MAFLNYLKLSIIKDSEVKKSIKLAEKLMKGQGRILVRESGTESTQIKFISKNQNPIIY